ncbi:MAG: nitrate/sulfonate/bicarbonate ABC transporter ATP-binding protein [Anaeromyxobacteraceae bacterium]
MAELPATRAQSPSRSPLVSLERVSHSFVLPSGQRLEVLRDVSVEVRPGEVVALLGPSGCGKSTILRILAGLIRPTGGLVRAHGAPLDGLASGIAIVFQGFALFPWMTVQENVRAVLSAAGLPELEAAPRCADAIRMVGLSGFEEAYPRELSGGMKQRVGLARALSLQPEALFMDEPFSQVDALTAEAMRAEILDIWAAHHQNPTSLLLVSHDIKEVVTMADRIVVLSANPGRVRTVVENALPRPRDARSPEVTALIDRLHDLITGHELPDLPPAVAAAAAPQLEILPAAPVTEVVGLLEWLDARGGQDDVFRIAAETAREFGHVLSLVKAAELLDLVDTPKRLAVLTPTGRQFTSADPHARKAIWRARLLDLRLFADVRDALAAAPEHRLPRDFVLETIVLRMPAEDYEKIFDTWVGWARYGDLFAYDETEGVVTPQ